jgi:hypothetical protein
MSGFGFVVNLELSVSHRKVKVICFERKQKYHLLPHAKKDKKKTAKQVSPLWNMCYEQISALIIIN